MMLRAPNESPHSRVRQWEAAGTNLARSLAAYVDSCRNLSVEKVEKTLGTRYLVSRLDHMLGSLHVELEQQITQSRCTLARLRNKLAGTFYSIPEEILAEIFTLVVYDRAGCEIRFMEDDISAFYRRLNTLLAVCRVWRKVGTSHGALWTLIPMISRKSGWLTQPAAERSYENAGGHRLHLAASIEKEVRSAFAESIWRNIRRFQSINVAFESKSLLIRAISILFRRDEALNALTELYLYYYFEPSKEIGISVPEPHEFLTSPDPSDLSSLSISQTFRSLRTLRLKNIHIHWQLITLPNLVELRIESVMIGTKSNFKQLLIALQTAPQLQKLELISLNTRLDPHHVSAPVQLSIPLPNLQRLYLGDLLSDDAELVLRSIIADSYRVSLYLTIKMASVIDTDSVTGLTHVGLDGLTSILQGREVDTLLIKGDVVWVNWVDIEAFRELLHTLPLVTTLKLDLWEFGQSEWEALTRPKDGTTFCKLCSICIFNIRLDPQEEAMRSLENFLSSHPIHHLTFGGTIGSFDTSDRIDWMPIKASSQITRWLKSKAPNIELLDDGYIPPEFRTNHWELW